jgi:nucleotide-binding universal stress UspA family protein
MKKILVPTDFSPLSDNALAFACQIALQKKSEIFLLNIQSLPANDDASMAIELIKTIEESAKERLKIKKDELKETYKGLDISTHFSFGIPSLTIKEYLESKDYDLVVMGTKGATGVDKFLFGSVAESISKHASCPVIIVHAENQYKPIEHIAVPIDINYKFGESHTMVQKIVEYSEMFKADLNWFYVNTQKKDYQTDIHYFLEDGKKIDIEIIEGDTVEEGIEVYCQSHPVDLLIILKRDYSLVHQLFHRNIFGEILKYQSLPIMVVHYI